MKLKALSHYEGDKDTRFGDCTLLSNFTSLVIYDCGHEKHAEYVKALLREKPLVSDIHIVVSHNDSDHTKGVCVLLEWLYSKSKYDVRVYTHQYLKHVDTIGMRIKCL